MLLLCQHILDINLALKGFFRIKDQVDFDLNQHRVDSIELPANFQPKQPRQFRVIAFRKNSCSLQIKILFQTH